MRYHNKTKINIFLDESSLYTESEFKRLKKIMNKDWIERSKYFVELNFNKKATILDKIRWKIQKVLKLLFK